MDYKKVGAAGVLLTLLLSGCGTQAAQTTQDTTKQATAAQDTAAKQDATQQDSTKQDASANAKSNKPPQMSEKQREMMFTFQSLLAMDKADGLAITKDQAQPMLTVVQDGISKGELSSDAQAKLTEKLTAEQKKYFDDSAAKMQQRMNNMKQNQGQGNANAKPQASADASAQGAAGTKNGQGQGKPADGQATNGKAGQDKGTHGQGGPGGGNGKNAGEQLVELLQSKLK